MQAMKIEDVDPQLQSGARKFPKIRFDRRWVLVLVRFVMRLGFFAGRCPTGVSYADSALATAKARVYRGDGPPSGIGVVWMHGGGLIAGSYKMDNKMCSRYVEELGAVVCSVEYRLAPEHPFPAGIDDCYDVWQWFVEQAPALGVDPDKIIIAGQSGGSCLAAALAQRIQDEGGVQPIAQLLFCPMLDDRTAAREELDEIDHIGWTNRSNRAGWSAYLGCDAGAADVPKNSVPARREDLGGLSPTWIGIGDIDLFYAESKEYAERLQQAGVSTIFDVVPDAPHGFEVFGDGSELVADYFKRHFVAVRELIDAA